MLNKSMKNNSHIHFIAIGGSIMHQLAIALKLKGYLVTGSDDEIFDPASKNLKAHGIFPEILGWYPGKITEDVDAIILGMHAKKDNPELQKALHMHKKIYSFPEFVSNEAKDKLRIVIAGSHGKTTITSMIMHILNDLKLDFDYLVGSAVKGFERSVKITKEAKMIILEGDEYLSSPIDPSPKFMHYHPDIAVITGIAWDHINVFPTFENYYSQFENFVNQMKPGTSLIYNFEDNLVLKLINENGQSIKKIPYHTPRFEVVQNQLLVERNGKGYKLKVQGKHNLSNIEAAWQVCSIIGIAENSFYESIQNFEGAGKRVELIKDSDDIKIFRDFAHAPSKVKATLQGLKAQYPSKELIAVFELHTFSSLNKSFLPQYSGVADSADHFFVFIDPHALALKKLSHISPEEIRKAFKNPNIETYYEKESLLKAVRKYSDGNRVLIFMSSGNFGGLDISEI